MNERIKELALQAKLHSFLVLHYWGEIDALTDSEQEELENIQKFAQLIIQECAEVCRLKYAKSDAMSKECSVNFSKDVKKHFGVEE